MSDHQSRAQIARVVLLVAGGVLMCVSPFLPWIGGAYSTNAFTSIGPMVNPESALPEWLGAIPLAFPVASRQILRER